MTNAKHMRKRQPTRLRLRLPNERPTLTLTAEARRALLLEEIRSGITRKLHEEN